MSADDFSRLDSPIQREPAALEAELDGELLIASVETGNYFGVGASARRIWELLEQATTVDELCTKLASEFEGDREEIRKDVLEFLGELLRHGLIRVVENKS